MNYLEAMDVCKEGRIISAARGDSPAILVKFCSISNEFLYKTVEMDDFYSGFIFFPTLTYSIHEGLIAKSDLIGDELDRLTRLLKYNKILTNQCIRKDGNIEVLLGETSLSVEDISIIKDFLDSSKVFEFVGIEGTYHHIDRLMLKIAIMESTEDDIEKCTKIFNEYSKKFTIEKQASNMLNNKLTVYTDMKGISMLNLYVLGQKLSDEVNYKINDIMVYNSCLDFFLEKCEDNDEL